MLRRPADGGADARQRVAGNWLRHKAVQQIRGGVCGESGCVGGVGCGRKRIFFLVHVS